MNEMSDDDCSCHYKQLKKNDQHHGYYQIFLTNICFAHLMVVGGDASDVSNQHILCSSDGGWGDVSDVFKQHTLRSSDGGWGDAGCVVGTL